MTVCPSHYTSRKNVRMISVLDTERETFSVQMPCGIAISQTLSAEFYR
jgi:hypothetical protein